MKRDPLAAAQGGMVPASPLAALYARWRQPLVRLLQGRLGSRAQAEDTAQQVFTQMAASGRLPEEGKEQAYLSRAASNLAVDQWRRQGGERAIATVPADDGGEERLEQPADDSHDPVHQAQNRQYLARLEDALGELSGRQREAFTLHILEGLTQEQVAQRMAISVRMVARHVSRAYAYCELRLQYGSMEQMRRLTADTAPDPEQAPGCGPTP
ncbi:Probable RNA polymerase sigma factor fecI [Delftia tsuruhatensis]|uniref:RNA polymerase sigma factor n=1 Tax=Delftia tsuruhatensis TaxID=180282 RepID=UPI001E7ADB03|nr:sigma-70 family RNA polymerase sigma factor [Delftia tsuruhatensis]CAB5691269.1 Probable RNA polymerase sigma factor fecI [Delftia tsuruhatensis]CAC9676910.1 Probable RNA polymerase sigma factor fecI [Delftia tsuruhatensis]